MCRVATSMPDSITVECKGSKESMSTKWRYVDVIKMVVIVRDESLTMIVMPSSK
jgi:hypothetical protein